MSIHDDIEKFKKLTGLDPFSCDWMQVMIDYGCYPVSMVNKGQITGYAFQYPIPTKVKTVENVDLAVTLHWAIMQAVIWKIENGISK